MQNLQLSPRRYETIILQNGAADVYEAMRVTHTAAMTVMKSESLSLSLPSYGLTIRTCVHGVLNNPLLPAKGFCITSFTLNFTVGEMFSHSGPPEAKART
jgi:hypothetical protein